MDGSEGLTDKTDKREIAEWVKGAMERLDALFDEKTRIQIMENCGYNCAKVNRRVLERVKARHEKFKNVDEFLESEQRKPMKGFQREFTGKIDRSFNLLRATTLLYLVSSSPFLLL